MKRRFEYNPRGVCSSKIIIEEEGGKILSVLIIGGCPGNTQAVGKLCCGMEVKEVIRLLKGIDCRGRGTSCPDQLAIALEKMLEEKEEIYVH